MYLDHMAEKIHLSVLILVFNILSLGLCRAWAVSCVEEG